MSRHALQLCLAVGFGSEMTSVNSHSAYSFESRQARMEVIDFCPSTCNDVLKCIGPQLKSRPLLVVEVIAGIDAIRDVTLARAAVV